MASPEKSSYKKDRKEDSFFDKIGTIARKKKPKDVYKECVLCNRNSIRSSQFEKRRHFQKTTTHLNYGVKRTMQECLLERGINVSGEKVTYVCSLCYSALSKIELKKQNADIIRQSIAASNSSDKKCIICNRNPIITPQFERNHQFHNAVSNQNLGLIYQCLLEQGIHVPTERMPFVCPTCYYALSTLKLEKQGAVTIPKYTPSNAQSNSLVSESNEECLSNYTPSNAVEDFVLPENDDSPKYPSTSNPVEQLISENNSENITSYIPPSDTSNADLNLKTEAMSDFISPSSTVNDFLLPDQPQDEINKCNENLPTVSDQPSPESSDPVEIKECAICNCNSIRSSLLREQLFFKHVTDKLYYGVKKNMNECLFERGINVPDDKVSYVCSSCFSVLSQIELKKQGADSMSEDSAASVKVEDKKCIICSCTSILSSQLNKKTQYENVTSNQNLDLIYERLLIQGTDISTEKMSFICLTCYYTLSTIKLEKPPSIPKYTPPTRPVKHSVSSQDTVQEAPKYVTSPLVEDNLSTTIFQN